MLGLAWGVRCSRYFMVQKLGHMHFEGAPRPASHHPATGNYLQGVVCGIEMRFMLSLVLRLCMMHPTRSCTVLGCRVFEVPSLEEGLELDVEEELPALVHDEANDDESQATATALIDVDVSKDDVSFAELVRLRVRAIKES
eukprot:CAMPEP_0202889750 /NCGR_PEP_ID=MMETSP1392-20130828/335_1 /ASSEMBLY_ACC=CAM_ASM_000868 /TAXON_ID=225041 /ORGANISM="Chlamydomonas chlamydogama, Strain SAG 11-48b" /LENGTH=140 /DNA_ID=CAMNT_0049573151 /DNA_START=77 /DNA_END=499 /DNA_ORIENTATION=-